jgi:hypothetical protein
VNGVNGEDDNTSIWGRSVKGRTAAARTGMQRNSDDDTAWPRRRARHNGIVCGRN